MITALRRGLLALLAAVPLFALAAPSPQEVVQQTTEFCYAGEIAVTPRPGRKVARRTGSGSRRRASQ